MSSADHKNDFLLTFTFENICINFQALVEIVLWLYFFQLYDWIQEHEQKVLNIFYQFDPEEDDRGRKGKITRDNFVMCLQTISEY